MLNQLKMAHSRAKDLIQQRKLENKKRYDGKNKSELSLKRNDLVLVKNEVKKSKFDSNYNGPFRVEQVISPAVTKIRKRNKSTLVHNDKLKRALADHGVNIPPPLPDQPSTYIYCKIE